MMLAVQNSLVCAFCEHLHVTGLDESPTMTRKGYANIYAVGRNIASY